jgi:hypothetical protein
MDYAFRMSAAKVCKHSMSPDAFAALPRSCDYLGDPRSPAKQNVTEL